MSYREVEVYEIREVLRLFVRGESMRSIERLARVDRKTIRRYVGAAAVHGLSRESGEGEVTDELIGAVCEMVRPKRPDGHGESWQALRAHHDELKGWLVEERLNCLKVKDLLDRRGVVVPERTLQRYANEVLGVGRSSRRTTVRVADGEPGSELQVDFGRMGLVPDPSTGRQRVCWAR